MCPVWKINAFGSYQRLASLSVDHDSAKLVGFACDRRLSVKHIIASQQRFVSFLGRPEQLACVQVERFDAASRAWEVANLACWIGNTVSGQQRRFRRRVLGLSGYM